MAKNHQADNPLYKALIKKYEAQIAQAFATFVYDPTKDPDSPSFTGPSSMGGIVDALSVLGTGMTTTTGQEVYGAAKEAVQDALDYFSNPRGGIEVTAEKTEMPAGTALGKSPAVEIEELEPVGSLNNMFSPQGYSTVNTIGDITRDPLKEEAERIRDKLGY